MEIITISKFNNNKGLNDEDEEMEDVSNNDQIVTPGELITEDTVWMRGHGTFALGNKTYSSVAGTILKVNKLLSVKPLKGRYTPETGDHIIGRVIEVGNRRWKVDIGARSDAVLLLGSVNLPGGILRRKSDTDELTMRNMLKEGDLLNCEVQSLFQDGSASLHTRSLKYGKLKNGIFLSVPRSLIIRSKNHSFVLQGNVSIILGVNGYIWIYKTPTVDNRLKTDSTASTASKLQSGVMGRQSGYQVGSGSVSLTRLEEESSWEIYSDKNDENISDAIRSNIIRYRNAIQALAHSQIGINESRINMAYEASMAYGSLGSLTEPEVMENISNDVLNGEKMRGS
ncbi:exosome non-catalytic core subunit [Saccharomycopsis crataegensis]|uniref:Exosome non-catalytic core subunit n=1 Tax=Saccharomycopsis crataegensis TaxID=43959 RepID=A0AAV5QDK2_9ASCO|nr:exosome non-catalytic core subunit [Saccharomycopsis crataegensis]